MKIHTISIGVDAVYTANYINQQIEGERQFVSTVDQADNSFSKRLSEAFETHYKKGESSPILIKSESFVLKQYDQIGCYGS